MQEPQKKTSVSSFSWENPLEEGLATHSSTLVWRIPWTEELAYDSPWGHKESDMTEHTCAYTHTHTHTHTHTSSTCQIVDVLPHGELTEWVKSYRVLDPLHTKVIKKILRENMPPHHRETRISFSCLALLDLLKKYTFHCLTMASPSLSSDVKTWDTHQTF